ncbi:hypothetical protein B0H14DRAFT_2564692 [Mycena olivaceomarginata]|nr:hypothetical protein B0H14DRAFT_2564692 [Mycena olivaceomarginata]
MLGQQVLSLFCWTPATLDGNFKMQRKNKQDDPNDMGLNGGNAYCVPEMRHKSYLGSLKPSDETGTCSHLKAARMQDIAKLKNAVITGVVAVQSTRFPQISARYFRSIPELSRGAYTSPIQSSYIVINRIHQNLGYEAAARDALYVTHDLNVGPKGISARAQESTWLQCGGSVHEVDL